MEFDSYFIRLVEPSDAEAFLRLVERNRPRLEDFFAGTVARTRTMADTEAYVNEMLQKIEANLFFPFFILHRDSGQYIGYIDVKNIDWNIPKAEIGLFIDKDYEGKGIMSGAFRMMVDYLVKERKFRKLYLRTHPTNIGVRTIAEKNGFQLEGLIRTDYKTSKGELVDMAYYGLVSP